MNIDLMHFTPMASKDTLVKSLNGRGDINNGWVHSKVTKCVEAFKNDFSGSVFVAVGVFDLLEQDGSIRSILYVFGVGFGRVIISGLGLFMMAVGGYLLRLIKSNQISKEGSLNDK